MLWAGLLIAISTRVVFGIPNVVSWGSQTNVPTGLSNAVAVAGGHVHSLALCADGSVVIWGSQTNVPVVLSKAVAVSAGYHHSLVLRVDGTVAAWGDEGCASDQIMGLKKV